MAKQKRLVKFEADKGNGSWYIYLDAFNELTGKVYRTRWATEFNKNDARSERLAMAEQVRKQDEETAKAKKYQEDKAKGVTPALSFTFGEALTLWLDEGDRDEHEKDKPSASNVNNRSIAKKYFGELKAKSLTDLSQWDFEDCFAAIDRSGQTKLHIRNVAKQSIKYAIRKYRLSMVNVVDATERPGIDSESTPHPFEPADLDLLLKEMNAATHTRTPPIYCKYSLMFAVAAYTGLRKGELFALRLSDVATAPKGFITVGNSHERNRTKDGKQAGWRAISEQAASFIALAVKAVEGKPNKHGLLFPDDDGERIPRQRKVEEILRTLIRDVGKPVEWKVACHNRNKGCSYRAECVSEVPTACPKCGKGLWVTATEVLFGGHKSSVYHFHDFRSTMITNAVDAGVPIETVARMAGHSDPRTTLKHYLVCRPNSALVEQAKRIWIGETRATDFAPQPLPSLAEKVRPVPHIAKSLNALRNLEREAGFEPVTFSLGTYPAQNDVVTLVSTASLSLTESSSDLSTVCDAFPPVSTENAPHAFPSVIEIDSIDPELNAETSSVSSASQIETMPEPVDLVDLIAPLMPSGWLEYSPLRKKD